MRDLPRLIVVETGVFTSAELQHAGYDRATLRRRLRDGSLIRLRKGWYATPAADAGVVEAVRRGGALSCVSALRFHKIWVPPGQGQAHVRVSKHGKQQRGRFCQGHGRPVPVTTAVDPIPVALGCAARCLGDEDWIVVCDSVLNSAESTVPELQAQMGVLPVRLRELMARCDPSSQSGTESITRLRLRAAGFAVEVQPGIAYVGRVDLRVGRLLIECDSKAHHTSLENYQNDRRRDRRALVERWLTMRITYDDVLYGWDEVLADIRSITRTDRHRIRRHNRSLEG
ncbi:type IV toxin-antitoxin system AbiEi family antitoxin domain-containing protein [Williamsia sp.]|uniref:type IV toxin-antitoxin system AbiEi family antitoxin domain-containing protein n=1 Tax=Williamsia sp. TaxID=1872085 RepID=UPI002F9415F7